MRAAMIEECVAGRRLGGEGVVTLIYDHTPAGHGADLTRVANMYSTRVVTRPMST